MPRKKTKTLTSRQADAAARRRASIEEHGGTGCWRPRAATFRDRKKAANRRACRGKVHTE